MIYRQVYASKLGVFIYISIAVVNIIICLFSILRIAFSYKSGNVPIFTIFLLIVLPFVIFKCLKSTYFARKLAKSSKEVIATVIAERGNAGLVEFRDRGHIIKSAYRATLFKKNPYPVGTQVKIRLYKKYWSLPKQPTQYVDVKAVGGSD